MLLKEEIRLNNLRAVKTELVQWFPRESFVAIAMCHGGVQKSLLATQYLSTRIINYRIHPNNEILKGIINGCSLLTDVDRTTPNADVAIVCISSENYINPRTLQHVNELLARTPKVIYLCAPYHTYPRTDF